MSQAKPVGFEERTKNYQRQNRSEQITFKQRRRLVLKFHKNVLGGV